MVFSAYVIGTGAWQHCNTNFGRKIAAQEPVPSVALRCHRSVTVSVVLFLPLFMIITLRCARACAEPKPALTQILTQNSRLQSWLNTKQCALPHPTKLPELQKEGTQHKKLTKVYKHKKEFWFPMENVLVTFLS